MYRLAVVALLGACAILTLSLAPGLARSDSGASAAVIQRGRYLVVIGHCNTCHTAGYSAAAGKVSEDRWLMGNPVGWRGKSGTTYASNLRLFVQSLSEDGWLQVARTFQSRPPMPWWSLRDTTDEDLTPDYSRSSGES